MEMSEAAPSNPIRLKTGKGLSWIPPSRKSGKKALDDTGTARSWRLILNAPFVVQKRIVWVAAGSCGPKDNIAFMK
jgi:hypothetical protein